MVAQSLIVAVFAARSVVAVALKFGNVFTAVSIIFLNAVTSMCSRCSSAPQLVIEAVKKAKQYGTVVSYDLNYRPSLWKSIGGQKRAQEVNREIANYVE